MTDSNRSGRPVQPRLFDVQNGGRFEPEIGVIGPLRSDSQLPVARYWFRQHLIAEQRPDNTLKSYMYDLSLLERRIGLKRINEITRGDIAGYLGDANTRSTKKRRLTSASQFFNWLVKEERVLEADPTESFYPDKIALKTPKPLHPEEQARFLAAALDDGPRSALMCWMMLRVGLGRSELLDLEPLDIELFPNGSAEITIFPRTTRMLNKERKLLAGTDFGELFEDHMSNREESQKLFTILPQSVNKMVDRIAARAGISKKVTPQTLRDTFAVEMAREGADEEELLRILGLADDARNRMSVQRYLKLGGPAINSRLAAR